MHLCAQPNKDGCWPLSEGDASVGNELGSSSEVSLKIIGMTPDLWLDDLEPTVCGKLLEKKNVISFGPDIHSYPFSWQ